MQPQVSRSTIPFQISVQEKLDRTPLLYTVMQKLQNSISSHVEGGCGGVEGVELGVDGGGVDFFLFVFLIDDVSYVLDNE